MKEIDPDIIEKIHSDFKGIEAEEVKSIMKDIFDNIAVVGASQFARSLLFLSDGDLDKLKKDYLIMANKDPRDVILAAERKARNPGHYFVIPFSEIEGFLNNIYKEETDDLPPF